MDSASFDTPILLLIYRRPDTTRRVFETIRSVRPASLYVAADGPRANVLGEAEKCAEARRIATAIDWNCTVRILFRVQNLGAGLGVASAISWFFEQEPEGIILEDDCVPHPSFYRFCSELLAYYRDDASIMHIGGNNFVYGQARGRASYYFSKYTLSWGWASWGRAWRHYDFTLIPEGNRSHIWDAQWMLSVERNHGVSILPRVNLVKNIGIGPDATHTKTLERALHRDVQAMDFPLIHPASHAIDIKADRVTYYVRFRLVRYPNCIWAYRLWDSLYAALKALKRRLLKTRRGRS